MKPTGNSANLPIETVVEECRLRLMHGGSVEACLAAYPAHAGELAQILPVVAQTMALSSEPEPRYADAARRRFQSSLATARQSRDRAARPVGFFGRFARLAVPLALVLILSASGLGLVQAADGSLPDSPLYGVKQATENVSGALATSPQARAILQTRLASTRKAELERALAAKKGPVVVVALAQSMVNSSNLATDQAMLTQAQVHDELVAHLRPLLAAEQKDLATLSADSHPPVAARGKALAQQLAADEQTLSTPKAAGSTG